MDDKHMLHFSMKNSTQMLIVALAVVLVTFSAVLVAPKFDVQSTSVLFISMGYSVFYSAFLLYVYIKMAESEKKR